MRFSRLILTVLSTLALVVWLSGCTTAPAHDSLLAVGRAVDKSVTVYYDLVARGQVQTNDVPRVSKAYNDFQAMYRTSLMVLRFDPKMPPDTNIIARAGAVLRLLAEAQGRTR